jgi:hypothetical protein
VCAFFFIQDSPTVRITNSDTLRIVENTTLELACAAQDGNPTIASFSWYKDNSTASIAMISNLSISKIYRTDAGVYRCEGSNNIGQDGVDSVYVNVLCKSFYNNVQDISLSLLRLYCSFLSHFL